VNDKHWDIDPPVESFPDRVEQTAPAGLTHDDEIPAAGAGLLEKRGSGPAARHELRYRDVLGHEPSGVLDISLRPPHQVLVELLPTHRERQRARARDRRSRGHAAEESQPSVAGLDQLDRSCQRFPGGLAVIDSDEDAVEHRGS
jgi:hypothetical protein